MSIFFVPLGLLGILIVPAILVGVIILLVKGGAAARWVLGIALLLIVVGFFLKLFTSRKVVYESAVSSPMPVSAKLVEPAVSQGAIIQINKDPVVWSEGIEEELTPVVFSSLESAAYGLGVQLQDTLEALPQSTSAIILSENSTNVDIALLEQLRRGLKYVLPDIDVGIYEEAPSDTPIKISLLLSEVHEHSIQIPETRMGDMIHMAQVMPAGNQQGTLQAIVETADNKYVQQVQFDHRSWLYDTDAFRAAISNGQWAVITSSQTAVTKEQALEQLKQAAVNYISDRMSMTSPTRPVIQPDDLRNYGFIVDEYTQQLKGLSGPIWRGALLLEISPQRMQIMQMIQRDKAVVVAQMRKSMVWRIISLLGMILVISILYAIVNAVTKGYYSAVWAVIAVAVFLVFVSFFFIA